MALERPCAEWAPTLGGVYLYLSYNADFVGDIKREVPSGHRHWDADVKVWYVSQSFAETAIKLARAIWPQLDTTSYDRRQSGSYDHARKWGRAQNPYGFDPNEYERTSAGWRKRESGWASGPSAAPTTAHTTLHLLPTAPPEVVRAAYKALAIMYHPDKGGNADKMRAVNAAMDSLKKVGKV